MKRTREEEAVVAWVEEAHRKQGTSGCLDHISAGAEGLFTSRKSDRAGAKILSVPLSCMLTCEKAMDSPLGVAFGAFSPTTSPAHLFWLFITQARRWAENSFHVFIASLSANAPDPANWPAHEREELKDTILYPILLKVNEEMEALAALVAKFVAEVDPTDTHHMKGVTAADLLWARGHHRSRRFADALNPDERATTTTAAASAAACRAGGASQVNENGMGVMIPLMDKTNHSPNVRVSWRIEGGNEVAYHCEEAVNHVANKGEVFNNYGPKSNEMLLLDFGFALANNPFDGVSLTLCVGDGSGGVKRLGPFQVRRPSDRWPTFPRELWRALANPLETVAEKEDNSKKGEGEEGDAEEDNVDIGLDEMELLQAQLAHRLKLLAGSEKADSNVKKLTGNRRFVALYRNGQREVLRAALEELEQMMGDAEDDEEMEEMDDESDDE